MPTITSLPSCGAVVAQSKSTPRLNITVQQTERLTPSVYQSLQWLSMLLLFVVVGFAPASASAATCGNGFVEGSEACDDGNTTSGDGCSSSCSVESGATCTTVGSGSEYVTDGNFNFNNSVPQHWHYADSQSSGIKATANTEPEYLSPAYSSSNRVYEVTGNTDLDQSITLAPNQHYVIQFRAMRTTRISEGEANNIHNPARIRVSVENSTIKRTSDTWHQPLSGGVVVSRSAASAQANGFVTQTISFKTDSNTGARRLSLDWDHWGGEVGTGAPSGVVVDDITLKSARSSCTVPTSCGDGSVNRSSEACDDGNTNNTDACSNSCLLNNGQTCTANSKCQSGICDSTENPDVCEAANTCGNNAVETGEACDDGNTTAGDGCNASCLRENEQSCSSNAQCASGVCDTSGAVDRCEGANSCGNSVVETGEACDDGNTNNTDACSNSCLLNNGQTCTANSKCQSGICDSTENPDVCEAANTCGNNAVETGEACDDGNTNNTDACSNSCLLNNGQTCTANSKCQSGICDSTENPDVCEAANTCGNNAVETGEACDDGNTNNTDACSNSCLLNNGQTCTANSKCQSGICDSTENPDVCEAANTCGNNAVETGEACDDGNSSTGDGCNASCLRENGKPCDSSNQCASSICDTSGTTDKCEAANSCGNNILETGEACDDGNTTSDDGCSASCFTDNRPDGSDCSDHGAVACASGVCDASESPAKCEPANSCGNNILETGEVCDDGNTAADDGCSPLCLFEEGSTCTKHTDCYSGVCDTTESPGQCEPAFVCGNGLVESEANETCDDGANNSDTEPDACRTDCTRPACGDGVVDSLEGCDHGAKNNNASSSCRANCAVITCGDGVVDEGEACDDGESNSNTEPDACRSSCVEPTCGDGVVDGDELCDDRNRNNGDGCSTMCTVEDGWLCSTNESESSDCTKAEPEVGPDPETEVIPGLTTIKGGAGCTATPLNGANRSTAPAPIGSLLVLVAGVWLMHRRRKSHA